RPPPRPPLFPYTTLFAVLDQRWAAAQRMPRSMTPEQREALMALSAQAFGSPELMQQLARIDTGLQSLRPDLDWSGSESFEGEQGLGMGEGAGVMSELAELESLAEQLAQSYAGPSPSDLDIEALGRHLGREAAISAQELAQLERAMRESNLLRRGADGELRLSP